MLHKPQPKKVKLSKVISNVLEVHEAMYDMAEFRSIQYNGTMAVIDQYHIKSKMRLRASLWEDCVSQRRE